MTARAARRLFIAILVVEAAWLAFLVWMAAR
jgi:hypothetical protein